MIKKQPVLFKNLTMSVRVLFIPLEKENPGFKPGFMSETN